MPVKGPAPSRAKVRRAAAEPKIPAQPSVYVIETIKGDKRDVSKF
jgi:hypothetical protein